MDNGNVTSIGWIARFSHVLLVLSSMRVPVLIRTDKTKLNMFPLFDNNLVIRTLDLFWARARLLAALIDYVLAIYAEGPVLCLGAAAFLGQNQTTIEA
jgi:hypothetical protein